MIRSPLRVRAGRSLERKAVGPRRPYPGFLVGQSHRGTYDDDGLSGLAAPVNLRRGLHIDAEA